MSQKRTFFHLPYNPVPLLVGCRALAYIGLSLLIDVIRADAGCEVMALPGLLSKKRTHLACLAFTPIDWLEQKFSPDK